MFTVRVVLLYIHHVSRIMQVIISGENSVEQKRQLNTCFAMLATSFVVGSVAPLVEPTRVCQTGESHSFKFRDLDLSQPECRAPLALRWNDSSIHPCLSPALVPSGTLTIHATTAIHYDPRRTTCGCRYLFLDLFAPDTTAWVVDERRIGPTLFEPNMMEFCRDLGPRIRLAIERVRIYLLHI